LAEIDFETTNLRARSSLRVESPCSVKAVVKGNCSVGAFSYIDQHSEIARTDIGRFCSIARNVLIGPSSHPTDRFSTHLFVFTRGGAIAKSRSYRKILRPHAFAEHGQRTRVGNDVWIGANVVIRRGVTVGDGAIIAAGAVVVKDVQPYEIVGGVPARHIRFRFEQPVIDRMLALQWWNYDLSVPQLEGVDYREVPETIARFEAMVADGTLPLVKPRRKAFKWRGIATDDGAAPEDDPPVAQAAQVGDAVEADGVAGAQPHDKASGVRRALRTLLRKAAKLLE